MNAYEELLTRVAKTISGSGVTSPRSLTRAEQVLAEVLRTLEVVTPEMGDAWNTCDGRAADHYLAMLRASPITPP
jgi:hypothetical protein